MEHLVQARGRPCESPLWDETRRCLWWVEIDRCVIHRYDPVTTVDEAIEVPGSVGAVGLATRGRLVVALDDGVWLLDPAAGLASFERVCEIEANNPRTRANDGAAAPDGTYWIGTMAVDASAGAGALYNIDHAGLSTRVLSPVSISNGIDWLSETEAIYVDSLTHSIDRISIDPQTRACVRRATLVRIRPEDGMPDGLTIDAEGSFWVAIHGGGEVRRYSLDGALLDSIMVPAKGTTSCAFGGGDLRELYITAMDLTGADGGLYRSRVDAQGRAPFRFGTPAGAATR